MGSDSHYDIRHLRYANLPDVGLEHGHLAGSDLHLPLRSRLLLRLQAGEEEKGKSERECSTGFTFKGSVQGISIRLREKISENIFLVIQKFGFALN